MPVFAGTISAGVSYRVARRADTECAGARGQVLDPLWWRCAVAGQREVGFAASQHVAGGAAADMLCFVPSPMAVANSCCQHFAVTGC